MPSFTGLRDLPVLRGADSFAAEQRFHCLHWRCHPAAYRLQAGQTLLLAKAGVQQLVSTSSYHVIVTVIVIPRDRPVLRSNSVLGRHRADWSSGYWQILLAAIGALRIATPQKLLLFPPGKSPQGRCPADSIWNQKKLSRANKAAVRLALDPMPALFRRLGCGGRYFGTFMSILIMLGVGEGIQGYQRRPLKKYKTGAERI